MSSQAEHFCYKYEWVYQCHALHTIVPYTAILAYQGSFFHELLKIGKSYQLYLIEINNINIFYWELTNFLIT